MKDRNKTKEQLVRELTELRRRLAEFETSGHLKAGSAGETKILQGQTVQALEESEEKFRKLADEIPSMIFINLEGRVVYANKQCEEIMGYTREEIYSPDFDYLSLIAPEYLETVKANFRKHMAGKEIAPYEYAIITREGKRIHVIITTRLIQYEGRDAILGIVTDITDRKKVETELQKAQQMESLKILAASVAHNFNNILTALVGNISLAKMYGKPGMEIFDLLGEAERAAMRAKNVVQQLLTFSEGGIPVKETLYIGELMKDTVSFLASNYPARCEFSIQQGLWPVDADIGQIRQVINTLIINAQQSTPEGGSINISARNITAGKEEIPGLEAGEYVKIIIEYEGIGISGEDLSSIFNTHSGTRLHIDGIGLAAASSIIQKHDGHIEVSSRPGTGTAVSIYLPASDKKEMLAKEVKEGTVPYVYGGSGKILVMDDENIVLDVLARMLEQCGYTAESARDGKEAIALYNKAMDMGQPFDAVILDIIVPGGMGGRETIKRLIKIDPDVMAIVSSGYSKDPIMARYEEYGFRGVLSKPYRLEELSSVLEELLKQRR